MYPERLVVTRPFSGFAIGDVITDPEAIEVAMDGENVDCCVAVAAAPQPAKEV